MPLTARREPVVALAMLSVAAGFLHAAVIDAHRGHGIAAWVFAGVAVFQIAWAGLVVARPSRAVLTVGAVGSLLVAVGWCLSRSVGIEFIDGFQDVEDVGFTDTVATVLEAMVAIGAAALAAYPGRSWWPEGRLGVAGLASVGLLVAGLGVPAAAEAPATHEHDGEVHGEVAAAGHEHGDGADHADGDHAHEDEAAAVHEHGEEADDAVGEPVSVAPDGSIVGGGPDVTDEQRAAAEELLAKTVSGLWQWTDDEKVHAAGFRSIGDGITGTEHLVNWNWILDDVYLDPDHPESLVYRTTPNGRVLEAAMYIVPPDKVPDIGGTLTQWHIHNNLCYAPMQIVDGAPERRVIGLTQADGTCANGESLTPHAPMLHVWLVERECGPFSALEGVGAGQAVAEAPDATAEPDCQHSH